LGLSPAEISILLLDDAQITALNRKYLSRNYPTDVLSFPMAGGPYPDINPQLLGDVVISVETAFKQAHESDCSLQEELACLLIHGILHLLGYDHERSAAERMKMRRLKKKLLQQLCDEGILSGI
jgi:probable rRNA maturation factor